VDEAPILPRIFLYDLIVSSFDLSGTLSDPIVGETSFLWPSLHLSPGDMVPLMCTCSSTFGILMIKSSRDQICMSLCPLRYLYDDKGFEVDILGQGISDSSKYSGLLRIAKGYARNYDLIRHFET
jgi:hypothetical protein